MKSPLRHAAVLILLSVLVAIPAMAGVYRVELKNGNSFETRYKPRVAEWDETKVVFLTDVGNRITLAQDDIVDIVADMQVKGFGTVLDTTTIVLGWAPNDAPVDSAPSPEQQFQQYLDSLRSEQRPNTVQQFVDTEDAGQGGLSTWEFNADNFTGGPGGENPPPVIVAPPMRQAPAAGAGEGGVLPRGDGGGGDGGS